MENFCYICREIIILLLMKKFTFIALCALCAASGAGEAAAKRLSKPTRPAAATLSERLATIKADAVRRAGDAGKIWRARQQEYYGWDGSAWELRSSYDISYTGEKVACEVVTDAEGGVVRSTYTYGDNSKSELVEQSDNGSDFQNVTKKEYVYDARVPSFVVERYEWNWMDGSEWVQNGNNYTQTVTRNSAGNVTLMERAVLFQGIFDPTYRLNVTYGADGKASEIAESNLTYDYGTSSYAWEDGDRYTDIVWHETNGQIVSLDDLSASGNLLKSATIDMGDGEIATTEFEYDANGGFVGKMTGGDETESYTSVAEYTPLDDNGSYTLNTTMTFYEDGEPYGSESYKETYEYDANGLILLEEMVYVDGEEEFVESRLVGKVEYDSTNGYPASWELSYYDMDEDAMVNDTRVVFSDYIDVAGIGTVGADNADKPVEYYNLQGMRINAPVAGEICIRRQGSSAVKIMVK